MSEELKPCPFCGGEAEIRGGNEFWHVASCKEFHGTHFLNKQDAIDKWNNRPIEDHYKRLSGAALDYIKESPCDHYIFPEQKDAWNKLQSILKERVK